MAKFRLGKWWHFIGLILALILLSSCSAQAPEEKDIGRQGVISTEPAPGAPSAEDNLQTSSGDETGEISFSVASIEDRVIKAASLEIEVTQGKVREVEPKVRFIAESRGGYVQSSQLTSYDESNEAYITIVVPVADFSSAVEEISKLGEVVSSEVSGKDVTAEYHDLELDLSHWRTERQAALALLDKAQTIDEIIKVRQFLEPIDREITRIEGQLKYLEAKSDFSSIQVTLREKGAKGVSSSSFWYHIWRIFLGTLNGILVFLAVAFPIALLALAIYFAVRAILKRPKKESVSKESHQ